MFSKEPRENTKSSPQEQLHLSFAETIILPAFWTKKIPYEIMEIKPEFYGEEALKKTEMVIEKAPSFTK